MSVLRKSKKEQQSYWQSRSERVIIAGEKSAARVAADLKATYEATEKAIQKEIESFYGRYATETGLSVSDIRKRLSPSALKSAKADMDRYYDEAKRLGLDPEYKTYLRGLSVRAYMSRLDELQANVRHELEKLAGTQREAMSDGLSGTYEESFYRSMFNIQQGTGLAGSFTALNTRVIERAVSERWLGKNYSSRIWSNKNRLVDNLNRIIPQGMALGQNPRVIARSIESAMGTGYNNAVRLARTEFSHIANSATYDSYKESGVVDKYQYLATLDFRTSEICASLDSQIYNLSEKMEGINWPPVHPNCVLPEMVIASPDANAITKSYYSGDIFKIRTSHGRWFSVTPNHIMLTSRGWVRAKDLVKGDNVIYYRGWGEFTGPFPSSDPADDNGVPTIEKLFASLAELCFVLPVTVPASSEDFKGDVVKDSEISIINVDSLLRDKVNSSILKFISDFPLIKTGESGEIVLANDCSMAHLLMGVGLAADEIMCGGSICSMLLDGTFRHFDAVSLRKASHYDSRLLKSANDRTIADTKFLGNVSNAFAGLIKGNDFSGVKDNSGCIWIGSIEPDRNSMLFEPPYNYVSVNSYDLRYLVSALSAFIEFDDIVDINVDTFVGHVYDASSLSTLYYCNGFLSSNCRSTTIPYFPPDDIDAMFEAPERIARGPDGKNYYVPASTTYNQWREGLETEGEKVRYKG